MSNRDELIQIIWDDAVADRVKNGKDLRNVPVVRPKVEAMADKIIAAGYRKPQTITTAEELDALPIKAVIRGKWLAEKRATPEGDVWFIAGRNMEWFTDDLVMRGGLPATVLDEAAQ
ncbi:hypothetical protein SEA_ZUCKER_56 [Arthrobacter phage Zucker]|nr:hypothetical protein SEA_ZUCKER_56 [Arthrobacter phage Zucker]